MNLEIPVEASSGIIVIGASRGGLQAVCEIARSLPATLSAAVLVVLHTAAHSPRLLATIVGSQTSLSVAYAKRGSPLCAGCLYIAPPNYHLVLSPDAKLRLDAGPKVHHSRPAADRLFESAAELYGERVIGVILTGGDGDGADGLRAIKAAGGISVIQDPAEAEDPGMPQSALEGGHPDYILRLSEIAPLLVKLTKSA